ncbi:MAG: hypothetical protein RL261_853, partial [Pseudomonadota bacterium]
ARVTAVDRARYLIRDEHDELSAALTGRFVHSAMKHKARKDGA